MSAPETVGAAELAAALGGNTKQLYRARQAGKVTDPDRRTIGGHPRWSLALAAEIVREHGKPVPAEWLPAKRKKTTAGG